MAALCSTVHLSLSLASMSAQPLAKSRGISRPIIVTFLILNLKNCFYPDNFENVRSAPPLLEKASCLFKPAFSPTLLLVANYYIPPSSQIESSACISSFIGYWTIFYVASHVSLVAFSLGMQSCHTHKADTGERSTEEPPRVQPAILSFRPLLPYPNFYKSLGRKPLASLPVRQDSSPLLFKLLVVLTLCAI
jgi:hypothetical protein